MQSITLHELRGVKMAQLPRQIVWLAPTLVMEVTRGGFGNKHQVCLDQASI